jgi:hypothetical protein
MRLWYQAFGYSDELKRDGVRAIQWSWIVFFLADVALLRSSRFFKRVGVPTYLYTAASSVLVWIVRLKVPKYPSKYPHCIQVVFWLLHLLSRFLLPCWASRYRVFERTFATLGFRRALFPLAVCISRIVARSRVSCECRTPLVDCHHIRNPDSYFG